MKLFSLVERERDRSDIIELISCPRNGLKCAELRGKINHLLVVANKSRVNKEYRKAIDEIRKAYLYTEELTAASCENCMELFRQTMIDSLKQINMELKRMSGGFIRGQRYKEVYLFSSDVLKELIDHYAMAKEVQKQKSGS